jgi:hypothetical protein
MTIGASASTVVLNASKNGLRMQLVMGGRIEMSGVCVLVKAAGSEMAWSQELNTMPRAHALLTSGSATHTQEYVHLAATRRRLQLRCQLALAMRLCWITMMRALAWATKAVRAPRYPARRVRNGRHKHRIAILGHPLILLERALVTTITVAIQTNRKVYGVTLLMVACTGTFVSQSSRGPKPPENQMHLLM